MSETKTNEAEKTTSVENIVRSLVKVRLTISHWGGKYISAAVSSEVANQKHAEPGSVDVNVVYLPPRYAKPISIAVSQLRTYWNSNTLPWENDSWRIVTAKKYQVLMDGVMALKQTFNESVANVTNNYDDVLESSKCRLADLFVAKNFPSQEQLNEKYGISIYRNSVNSAGDVRVSGLDEATIQSIRKDVSKQYEDQIFSATQDIVERLKTIAEDIVERTSKSDGEVVKFATLITKINKTCDSLNGLNITGDERIDNIISQMRYTANIDADTLRVNSIERTNMCGQAKSILSALDDFKG